VGILGIGTALPATARGNEYWKDLLKPRDESERRRDMLGVERSSTGAKADVPEEIALAMAEYGDDAFRGAKTRYVLAEDELVSDLEAKAVRIALDDAGVAPEDVDLLLVSSLVPDLYNPSNAPAVQDKAGLSRAAAWSLDVACASFQPQLTTATGLIASGMMKHVVVVQSSGASRILDYSAPMSPGFGDAATAAVIGVVPSGFGLVGQFSRTDGAFRGGIVVTPMKDGLPIKEWWRGVDGPWQISSFDLDRSKESGRRAGEFCRDACFGALANAGLTIDDVDLYLGNQSLGWFVSACRRSLGLPAEKALSTFPEVGNIGACSILYNLDMARRANRLEDGDVILMYSPAAGFTRSAAVYRWWEPKSRHP